MYGGIHTVTLSRTNPRAKVRWLFLGGLTVALMLAVAAITLAVHDEDFQLDGDVLASTTTAIGGTTQTVDWDSLFNPDGTNKTLPDGFEAARFDKDFSNTGTTFVTSDGSTFATGSKDTLPISGWQCNFDNNVNSKIDVANAYAAIYTADSGDEILYFGIERNANTGTANVGFWFLQDEAACESTGGAVTFSGAHTDGDLLVVSEFTGGGTVSTINVYRWNGGANGTLGQTPVAGTANADCRGLTVPVDDLACGASNRVAITTPWLTAAKTTGVGNNVPIAQFYEAGLNLTDANLGGKCFSTFIGDTRSSTSLTATLFDFSLGVLGSCQSGIVTTPQTGAGGSIPPAGSSIGSTARFAVRDQAVITVSGTDTFGGTVKFFLCGPLALTSTSNCQTGGVQIGAAAGEPVTGANGTATLNSATATLTSAGDYCWRAEYSGDAATGVPASTDPTDATNRSECFQINPVTPTLTTTASADVTLGNPISDTATLTGTARQPGTDGLGTGGTINATAATQAAAGGSITWTAFGPNNCTTVALAPTSRTVSGDGTYPTAAQTAVSFTPTAIGTYTFVASYNGSSPNTLGAGPSSCPPGPNDGDEVVTVTGNAALATTQDWLPNDTATLTGPTNLTGTLTFQLYTGSTCATGGTPLRGSPTRSRSTTRVRIDVQHLEHHVQGEGRDRRRLLVAGHLQRQRLGRSGTSVRDEHAHHHRLTEFRIRTKLRPRLERAGASSRMNERARRMLQLLLVDVEAQSSRARTMRPCGPLLQVGRAIAALRRTRPASGRGVKLWPSDVGKNPCLALVDQRAVLVALQANKRLARRSSRRRMSPSGRK